MFDSRSHIHVALAIALGLAGLTTAPSARADDQPFLTLYTTDIDPQGAREVEQWLGWDAGHAHGSYNAYTSFSEFEYGITDDLQGSLYLNYAWSRDRLGGTGAQTDSDLGVSGELIYRVMNVYFDPVGLAFYLEPSYSADSRGIETKILLQKNFLNDTVRFAFNTNFEDDWVRDQGRWSKQSALEFDAGLAYNITPDLSAGVEFDNEHAFEGLVLGAPASERSSAFFVGPTIQYVGNPVSVTIGAQTQVPWAGDPAHIAGTLHDSFVSDADRYRVALRLTHDF
jgi:hypothetical protein